MNQVLSQIQLQAFMELAQTKSFTKAAGNLNLTQSALSHRIRNLEEALETTLVIRHSRGLQLTEAGEKLLQFGQTQRQFEAEFLAQLLPRRGELRGQVRIAGVSTLMRSIVIPGMGEWIRNEEQIHFEFLVKEVGELPELLSSGRVDYVISTGELQIPDSEPLSLGIEENVLIAPTRKQKLENIYLDHDRNDRTTRDFLRLQSKKLGEYRRGYMDDIYGILDGVSAGLGRAVAPRHLAEKQGGVEILEGYKPLMVQILLYQMRQPYQTELQKRTREKIVQIFQGLSR